MLFRNTPWSKRRLKGISQAGAMGWCVWSGAGGIMLAVRQRTDLPKRQFLQKGRSLERAQSESRANSLEDTESPSFFSFFASFLLIVSFGITQTMTTWKGETAAHK